MITSRPMSTQRMVWFFISFFLLREFVDLKNFGSSLFAMPCPHLMKHMRREVIFEHQVFHTRKCLFYCAREGNDVDTILLLLDHFSKAFELALYDLEPSRRLLLQFSVHDVYDIPRGYIVKSMELRILKLLTVNRTSI